MKAKEPIWVTSNLNGWTLERWDVPSENALAFVQSMLGQWRDYRPCRFVEPAPAGFGQLSGPLKRFQSISASESRITAIVQGDLIGEGIGVVRSGIDQEWDTLAFFSLGHDPVREREIWQDLAGDRMMPSNRPLVYLVHKQPLTEGDSPSLMSAFMKVLAYFAVLTVDGESRV